MPLGTETLLWLKPWAFFFIAITLFILFCVLAYQDKFRVSVVVLVGAAISAAFVYVDNVSEIAASATSLTIKIREASDALVGLRKVALLAGESLIRLDSEIGSTPVRLTHTPPRGSVCL